MLAHAATKIEKVQLAVEVAPKIDHRRFRYRHSWGYITEISFLEYHLSNRSLKVKPRFSAVGPREARHAVCARTYEAEAVESQAAWQFERGHC